MVVQGRHRTVSGEASASVSPRILNESQGTISVVEGNVLKWTLPGPPHALAAILDQVRDLRQALTRLSGAIVAPITTFAPEPYQVLKDIPVVIQPAGDEFIATFFDANISTGGESQEEAVSNLRSLILDTFEYLESEPPAALGPEPARQLGVLLTFVKRV